MNICVRLNKRDELWEERLTQLVNHNPGVNIEFKYGGEELDLTDIQVLISNRVLETELDTANNLEAFFLPFTGLNRLPLEALNKKGVTLYNSHINADLVAEKAFTLGLSLLGRIVDLHHHFKGGWDQVPKNSYWTSLFHKKCGLLGMGEIGKYIRQLVSPFHCQIVTLDRYQSKIEDRGLVEFHSTVNEVCQHADIIFISLPLTKETNGMIDYDILSTMNGKYIINVGRAEVIKEADLYRALDEGILAGAALDVWYQYPNQGNYPSQYPFHELNNVILSPHCAAHTLETRGRVLEELVTNVEHYILDKEKLVKASAKRGY